MTERRKATTSLNSALPKDYLQMVTEVFESNFGETLRTSAPGRKLSFLAGGDVYGDEVLVRVSLLEEGRIAATTVYASCDFDPAASSPTVEDLLALCVDSLGDVFSAILEKKPGADGLPAIFSESLSGLDGIPYDWAETQVQKRKIFVRVDKANPMLDRAADDWLKKNDPEFAEREKANAQKAEELFVVSPAAKKGGKNDLH